MDRFSLSGVTLSVFFDTRRPKEDLTFPVKYRVTYLRKRVYYASGIDLTADQWNTLWSSKKRELREARELIQIGFDKIKEHIKDLVRDEGFSVVGLAKRLHSGRSNSIFESFYQRIEDLKETGQIGTASTYQCAINSISKYSNKDVMFSDITVDWLKRYESHLIGEGKSVTTIKFYIGALRAIINAGLRDRLITEAQYPFGRGKFEIKTGTGRKLALTVSQIGQILKYPLVTVAERRSRDLWFFSYLTNGINFNDMLRLKYKDILGGEIRFVRGKTLRTTKNRKEIIATLLPEMETIIKTWGNPDKSPENYIFPFITDKMDAVVQKRTIQNVVRLTNKKMSEISKGLNFETISTYTARHSYATVLKRSGANIAFISESLGHSDLRTTENYLASFEKEERAKNASLLTKFS